MKESYNVTIDFIGLQNEGAITGGNPVFAVALRKSLDAAGFESVIIDCCDSHDFSFLSDLSNKSTDFFKAVGALAVHEPLRNAESVPQAALSTGKPIWSSESYTTYSDANGGGCWARAISWGYVCVGPRSFEGACVCVYVCVGLVPSAAAMCASVRVLFCVAGFGGLPSCFMLRGCVCVCVGLAPSTGAVCSSLSPSLALALPSLLAPAGTVVGERNSNR